MPETMKQLLDLGSTTGMTAAGKLGALWCTLMHDSPMWPIRGAYQCRTCSRYHPVPWAPDYLLPAPLTQTFAALTRDRRAQVPSLRSALLPLFFPLSGLLLSTVRPAA